VKKPSVGDSLLLAGPAILVVSLFLPWHQRCVAGGEFFGQVIPRECVEATGFESPSWPWIPLAVVVALLMAAAVLARLSRPPAFLDGEWFEQAIPVGAIVVATMFALKVVDSTAYLAVGFWVGLVGTVLVLGGGGLHAFTPGDGTTPGVG